MKSGALGRSLMAMFVTGFWGIVALGFIESFRFGCVDVHEPFTKEVDVWSPSSGSRAVAPLDRPFGSFQLASYTDGRVYVHGFDGTPHDVWYEWDRKGERLVVVPTAPPRERSTSEAANAVVTYGTSGRALVSVRDPASLNVSTWVYDPERREIAEPPVNERSVDLGDLTCTLDLSDGARVAVGHTMFGATSAYLLEPKGTRWQPVAKLPKLDPERAIPGPDANVFLFDGPSPRLWDPRSGALTVLPGPNPTRTKAAVVSLDASHVLIAGGQSSSTALRGAFLLECALALAWLLAGLYGARILVRSAQTANDDGVGPLVFAVLLGFVPAGVVALVIEGLGHVRWFQG